MSHAWHTTPQGFVDQESLITDFLLSNIEDQGQNKRKPPRSIGSQ